MKLFVGCSAYDSIDQKYFDETKKLSEYLVSKKIPVVFGNYNRGLMGVLYNTYMENNGEIHGVCSKNYEKYYDTVSCDKELVESIYAQLEKFKKCDVLLYLPGGYGTYNEIFYMINSYATREIDSKIIIYNMFNYYDDIISIMNKIKETGFATIFDFVTVVNNYEEFKNVMEELC